MSSFVQGDRNWRHSGPAVGEFGQSPAPAAALQILRQHGFSVCSLK
jgi:hypothetical protein